MDHTLSTPRLKLTLITKADPGSQEFEWIHKLRTDEKAVAWSIFGISKSHSDTQKIVDSLLPEGPQEDGKPGSYRIAYAVHKILPPSHSSDPTSTLANASEEQTELVGKVNLKQVGEGNLVLPESLTFPASAAASTLSLELGYMFLHTAWGQGYAAEALKAVFDACKRVEKTFWGDWEKVHVRAIVNGGNPASLRVLQKVGVKETGIFEWRGEPIFLGGKWESESRLHIFGLYLVE
ncbi:hypothetical protein K491DRAFT_771952 [Lophiostoma macrostomum CBS 122681]|uniref:N-acetyltransferase domain-containing protein n=1 Tax=Lophiostoma macrostomum CBS 122681 TaxID=1314788 RepID=A0A6A6SNS6_9PLEO|nr:hypothetical protein K491DRAFT_771952 [Lophiostoma macrostomum CBS 122681]